MNRRLLAATTLAALAAPSIAWSQGVCRSDDNRVRIEDARNRIFTARPDRADYEGAERGLRFAARDCPTDPEVNGLMGLALLGMQSYVLAEQHLQRAEGFHDLNPAWWRDNGPVVVARLAQLRQTLGSLLVTADAPGALAHLPDDRIIALPMRVPVRITAGRFTLRITAPGREPAALETDVAVDEVARVTATLLPTEAPTTTPAPVVARVTDALPPPRPVTESRTPSPWRTVGWITAGVGAASVVAGAIAWASTSAQHTRGVEATASTPGAWGSWARYSAEIDSRDGATLCDRASRDRTADALAVQDLCAENQQSRTTAWVFSALGAALLGGGIATALLAPDRVEHTTPQVSATLGSSPRLTVEVAF